MSYSFSCLIFLLKKEKKPRNSRAPLRNQKGSVEVVVVEVKKHNLNGH